MSDREEIWQSVSQIATEYPLLECDRCAIAIMQWLNEQGIGGVILRITNPRGDYIPSKRYGANSITINGKHYGVEVMDKVFDNLSDKGLSREEWISDFRCRGGRFIIEELSLPDLLSLEEQK